MKTRKKTRFEDRDYDKFGRNENEGRRLNDYDLLKRARSNDDLEDEFLDLEDELK